MLPNSGQRFVYPPREVKQFLFWLCNWNLSFFFLGGWGHVSWKYASGLVGLTFSFYPKPCGVFCYVLNRVVLDLGSGSKWKLIWIRSTEVNWTSFKKNALCRGLGGTIKPPNLFVFIKFLKTKSAKNGQKRVPVPVGLHRSPGKWTCSVIWSTFG